MDHSRVCVISQYHMAEAEIRAARYEGFGASLWSVGVAGWKNICGGHADEGLSIFNLVFGLRNEKGAVPKGVLINHKKEQDKK